MTVETQGVVDAYFVHDGVQLGTGYRSQRTVAAR
jgi:hypothetical protein